MFVEKIKRSLLDIKHGKLVSGQIENKWKTPGELEFFAEYSDLLYVKNEEIA